MPKIVIANWKNKPQALVEAEELLEANENFMETGKNFGLVICPPFIYLEEAAKFFSTSRLSQTASLGAQDLAIDDKSSLTGEVSGAMLNNLGVRYVIIGHSERRWKLGESDAVVNQKLKTALADGLIPIVCIGEQSREDGFENIIREQVANTFAGLDGQAVGKCLIAYEPVWAISTNPGARPDNPESALEAMGVIRDFIKEKYGVGEISVLYGGSVNPANVRGFLGKEKIDGILVGGASVKKEDWEKILAIAAETE